MQAIDDLLIRIRRHSTGTSYVYGVEMWLSGGRRVHAEEDLQLQDDQVAPLRSGADLANYGLDLFNRLLSGRLAVAFQQAWATAVSREHLLRVRLALDPHAPELHAIPWELLHFDDSGGLAPPRPLATDGRIAFSRYIESETFEEGQLVEERPIRLLLVIADPSDLAERWNLQPVGRESEARDMRTRFSGLISAGQFSYDLLPVASPEALQQAIAQGGLEGEMARGYDAVLFMGHALHHEEHGSRLLLEDGVTGRTRLYPAEALVSLMQQLPAQRRPTLVMLISCNTAQTASNRSMNSLAAQLVISGGVPAVLAMQRIIEISLARRFTYHLSDHLLRDGVIDVAVNIARQRVYTAEDMGWSIPTLYMRSADGRLFAPNVQLEYVANILANPDYLRWSGPEFIEAGVLVAAPGQSWNLLRTRPEDAPTSVSVLETLHRLLTQPPPAARPRKGLVSQSNLIAVIGPPHSGQTTVLQRLAYDLALRVTQNPSNPAGIMISLSGYESQRGAGRLERQIVEQASIANPALGDAICDLFRPQQAPAQRARYIFLLDNLDSLPAQARLDLVHELAAMSHHLVQQKFVLTASQENFPTQILNRAHVLVLQPLSEQQILRYVRQREERGSYQIFCQIRDNRLLALASDPSLLAMIYARVAGNPQAQLTRNQVVQEYLDQALSLLTSRYSVGHVARSSLGALAWYSRWNHLDQIPLHDMFRILAETRRERDYSLEDLYHALCEARVLVNVGQNAARFVNPALHAYCAAVALAARPDMNERVSDIISLCSSPRRQLWWEDVLCALAGLLSDPEPLFAHLAAAIRAGSYTHALLAARCLEALPPEQEVRLPTVLREELLDACVLRLRADREPSAERREQMATALGRLSHPQVRHELRRILVERVRETSSGPRYEYTNVRIAAARALRNIYLPGHVELHQQTQTRGVDDLLLTRGYEDMASLSNQPSEQPPANFSITNLRNDRLLVRLMQIWEQGTAGRGEFRHILRYSPHPPERALAAFALGDMIDSDQRKVRDARQLLRIILSPSDHAAMQISDDWEDTMWAAADALTLFEPTLVEPLLTILVRGDRALPNSAAQQLAYLAGRVRAANPTVIRWLMQLLITNPSQTIKSKALQSLAWMGMGIEKERLELSDGRPGPTLKQVIQDIAAGREMRRFQLGMFSVNGRTSDREGVPVYLRRKAIEALAWIGDAETLADLGKHASTWPLELREPWYQTAATIRERG
ncbi:HEAT repeat-containing PBS lyase [Oscillochloris trichoides DG-6]|uniref:HEAT repeat-containing PBS lyase n=1 Tax=Oscillochloris trichoides DG-6 TaxID=765420 RepID=E1IA81_9CHLR|nr:CHAT domain-containing protein [Oscillochloris trichoides]EFO81835.1 HEAT repeat-containing PBS lyase [Oscillochloris trichoides DG-6]